MVKHSSLQGVNRPARLTADSNTSASKHATAGGKIGDMHKSSGHPTAGRKYDKYEKASSVCESIQSNTKSDVQGATGSDDGGSQNSSRSSATSTEAPTGVSLYKGFNKEKIHNETSQVHIDSQAVTSLKRSGHDALEAEQVRDAAQQTGPGETPRSVTPVTRNMAQIAACATMDRHERRSSTVARQNPIYMAPSARGRLFLATQTFNREAAGNMGNFYAAPRQSHFTTRSASPIGRRGSDHQSSLFSQHQEIAAEWRASVQHSETSDHLDDPEAYARRTWQMNPVLLPSRSSYPMSQRTRSEQGIESSIRAPVGFMAIFDMPEPEDDVFGPEPEGSSVPVLTSQTARYRPGPTTLFPAPLQSTAPVDTPPTYESLLPPGPDTIWGCQVGQMPAGTNIWAFPQSPIPSLPRYPPLIRDEGPSNGQNSTGNTYPPGPGPSASSAAHPSSNAHGQLHFQSSNGIQQGLNGHRSYSTNQVPGLSGDEVKKPVHMTASQLPAFAPTVIHPNPVLHPPGSFPHLNAPLNPSNSNPNSGHIHNLASQQNHPVCHTNAMPGRTLPDRHSVRGAFANQFSGITARCAADRQQIVAISSYVNDINARLEITQKEVEDLYYQALNMKDQRDKAVVKAETAKDSELLYYRVVETVERRIGEKKTIQHDLEKRIEELQDENAGLRQQVQQVTQQFQHYLQQLQQANQQAQQTNHQTQQSNQQLQQANHQLQQSNHQLQQANHQRHTQHGWFPPTPTSITAGTPPDATDIMSPTTVRHATNVATNTTGSSITLVHRSTTSTPTAIHRNLFNEQIDSGNYGQLHEAIRTFFAKIEDWGNGYCTFGPAPHYSDPNIKELKARCLVLTRPRDAEELMTDNTLRAYLVAALITTRLTFCFGPELLDGFEGLNDALLPLGLISGRIDSVKPSEGEAYNQMLEQRASIYRAVMQDENLDTWLTSKITDVTDDLFAYLTPMIPKLNHGAAKYDLKTLVKEAFQLGQRMLAAPREWGIQNAKRGDRWDAHSMIQRDRRLDNDPVLTESNGFGMVVRLGVAPSITEKDYSKGILSLQTVRFRAVLLTENGKLASPLSERKSQQNSYF